MEALSFLFLVPAAWIDQRERRIPNCISLTMLGLGIAWAAFRGGLSSALLGAALAFLFSLAVPGMSMGGGDVKLAAACGAWLGMERVGYFLLLTVFVIAMSAVAQVVKKSGWKGLFARLREETTQLRHFGRTVLDPVGSVRGGVVMLAAYAITLVLVHLDSLPT